MGGIGHHGAAQDLTDRASWASKSGKDGASLNSGGVARSHPKPAIAGTAPATCGGETGLQLSVAELVDSADLA